MAIDPQRMAAIMQRLQLANQGGDVPPAGPPGGGMMAPQGGGQPSGAFNSKISGTVVMAPAEGQQGGPPAQVEINGNVKITKSTAGGPPNMVRIEGDVTIAKPGMAPGGAPPGGPQGAPPGGPQGAPPDMAPRPMMPPGGMPPR